MTWKPNGVSTTSLTPPTSSANAASENGFTILSRVNFPTLPRRSFEPGSSEYSATSAPKSAPDFAFAATSSARFFASAFDRVMLFGAPSAPLYATSTCCAATASGGVFAAADATGGGDDAGVAGALAAAVALVAVAVGAFFSSQAAARRSASRTVAERRIAPAYTILEPMSPPRTLEELGWSDAFARAMPGDPALAPARVASVYSARVEVWTTDGARLASLRARVLREAPVEGGIAVGDWVAVALARAEASEDEVVVEHVLPRRTAFLRQAAGERSEPQAIAANVDRVFVITSVEGDFNPRRIERYLVAIRAGGADPYLVLTKADLSADVAPLEREASALAPTIVTSARDGRGVDALAAAIPRGVTAAFAGSSGVGKSALVNVLLGDDVQSVGAVREHDKRGRHTTTRRALFALPGGGLVVDTPGMRELKPWHADASADDDDAFADIADIAASCRYRDCRHEAEPGCAVRAAVASGGVDAGRVASFEKLRDEREARAGRQERFAQHEDRRRRARTATIALRKRVRER